ncbi:hypothetical protein CKO44_07790 [Rubrivivax gelatinosus]|uniref:hypothetical protein n=1 Tax=Rubrivivax gelatinosus TaxID=28068 RepID=UPI001906030D|nr:hypothetical protein [Rubrivivax gelatinosus]MBK1613370.1 hypothetical protein [Rubrivivax gelatinosus]MBZ8142874.1 hypothetical protein [Rubrivivax gelatinosus]
MAGDLLLFHIDTIVVDGTPMAFEDGSGTLTGAARFENETVLSASGDDYSRRKRIPTLFKVRAQFGKSLDPQTLTSQSEVQITARDTQSGRRALMPKCSFASMGDLGGGAVEVTWAVLAPIQWL